MPRGLNDFREAVSIAEEGLYSREEIYAWYSMIYEQNVEGPATSETNEIIALYEEHYGENSFGADCCIAKHCKEGHIISIYGNELDDITNLQRQKIETVIKLLQAKMNDKQNDLNPTTSPTFFKPKLNPLQQTLAKIGNPLIDDNAYFEDTNIDYRLPTYPTSDSDEENPDYKKQEVLEVRAERKRFGKA